MHVVVTPVNRAAFIAPLTGPPSFGSVRQAGYSDATIPMPRMRGAKADNLLYADVTIWGRYGPVWGGFVFEVAGNGALSCVGHQTALSWYVSRAAKVFTTPTIYDVMSYAIDFAPSYHWSGDESFITHDTTELTKTDWDGTTKVDMLNEALAYSAYEWGWYYEYTDGWHVLPHHTPAAAAAYIVTLSADDAAELSAQSLAETSDVVYTTWGTTTITRTTTSDTDASHYLVGINRSKAAYIVSPNTNSAGDAAALANAAKITHTKSGKYRTNGHTYTGKNASKRVERSSKRHLAALGHRQRQRQAPGVRSRARAYMAAQGTEGTVSSRVQTIQGTPAYLPDIRSGQRAIVMGLPEGPQTLRIEEVRCTGEHVAEIGFGIDSGRIDALLARVG